MKMMIMTTTSIMIIIIIIFPSNVYFEKDRIFPYFSFVSQMALSLVNWTLVLLEIYQIIWYELDKKFKALRMKVLRKKAFRFSEETGFSATFVCIDWKHYQLKFLLISGHMILVEGLSDSLKMKRGKSSATYVSSRKIHSKKYHNTDKLFNSRVRTLNIS